MEVLDEKVVCTHRLEGIEGVSYEDTRGEHSGYREQEG